MAQSTEYQRPDGKRVPGSRAIDIRLGDPSDPETQLVDFDPEHSQVLGSVLAIQRPPLLPEISLWLVAGHVDLNARCEDLISGGRAPYWAFCWGSGTALARHLLDHPELVRGKRVVDFGAGSGVLAIAAAMAGAAHVTAVDADPRARQIAARNAALNGVPILVADRVPEQRELLLAADVLYDEGAAGWLLDDARRGCELWLSDPHRGGAARPRVEPRCCVASTTFPDVDYPICSAFIYCLPAPANP